MGICGSSLRAKRVLIWFYSSPFPSLFIFLSFTQVHEGLNDQSKLSMRLNTTVAHTVWRSWYDRESWTEFGLVCCKQALNFDLRSRGASDLMLTINKEGGSSDIVSIDSLWCSMSWAGNYPMTTKYRRHKLAKYLDCESLDPWLRQLCSSWSKDSLQQWVYELRTIAISRSIRSVSRFTIILKSEVKVISIF